MKPVHISGEEKIKQSAARRAWGFQAWMATRALTGSRLSLTRMILTVGSSGEVHCHPNADEVIYLIRGRIAVDAGSETFSLEATDALAIPGGLSHQIHNRGAEEAELIISYSTGDREYVPGLAAKNASANSQAAEKEKISGESAKKHPSAA